MHIKIFTEEEAAAYREKQRNEGFAILNNIRESIADRTMTRGLYRRLTCHYREKNFVADRVSAMWSHLDRWRYRLDFVKFLMLGDRIYISVDNKVA